MAEMAPGLTVDQTPTEHPSQGIAPTRPSACKGRGRQLLLQIWSMSMGYVQYCTVGGWITFTHIHLCYFCMLACLGSLFLWLVPNPKIQPLPFVDALFTAVSVLSLTGLSCVNIQDWSTGGDVCIMVLSVLDSIYVASLFPVYLKLVFFKPQLGSNGLDRHSSESRKNALGEIPVGDADQWLEVRGREVDQRDGGEEWSVNMEEKGGFDRAGICTDQLASGYCCDYQLGEGEMMKGSPQIRVGLDFELHSAGEEVDQNLAAGPMHFDQAMAATNGHEWHDLENPQKNIELPSEDLADQMAAVKDVSDESKMENSQKSVVLDFSSTENCHLINGYSQLHQTQNPGDGDDQMLAALGSIHRLIMRSSNPAAYVKIHANLFRKLITKCNDPNLIRVDDGKHSSLHEMEEEMKLTGDPYPLRLLEHEALHALTHVVLRLALLSLLLGFLFLEIFLLCSPSNLQALRDRKINHVFFAFSTSIAAFSNSGIFFLNDNFNIFRRSSSAPILLCVALQSVIGNTLLAPTIRAIIRILFHRTSSSRMKLRYEYLLKHPRRCYTHLFPYKQTIWLVATVIFFTVLQDFLFLLLDWSSKALAGLTVAEKLVDSFFQSVTTRNAGATVLNLADISKAMLVIYAGMMYIAVYPVYLSRQSSRARRIKDHPQQKICDPNSYNSPKDTEAEGGNISVQLKRLLLRDSAYLFVAIFIICVLEASNINQDPLNFSLFNIFFEVISAYGNIGLSLGYSCELRMQPNTTQRCEDESYSFSGNWSTSGKLVLMVVMILGRHRVLPDEADEATRLPWKNSKHVSSCCQEDTITKMPD